jgi:hypothetical protein
LSRNAKQVFESQENQAQWDGNRDILGTAIGAVAGTPDASAIMGHSRPNPSDKGAPKRYWASFSGNALHLAVEIR